MGTLRLEDRCTSPAMRQKSRGHRSTEAVTQSVVLQLSAHVNLLSGLFKVMKHKQDWQHQYAELAVVELLSSTPTRPDSTL